MLKEQILKKLSGRYLAVSMLIAVWLPLLWSFYFPFPMVGLLTPILIIVSLIMMLFGRCYALLLVLLLNPLTISFSSGICEWFKHKPRFSYMGLPDNESFNLDTDSRCYQTTGGCIVRGTEWMTDSPHNFGLALMVKLFGFPPHTYHGPYPTKEQAIAITETASNTPPDQFLDGRIVVEGKPFQLGKERASALLTDFGMFSFEEQLHDGSRQVRAAMFKQRCLLVRVAMHEPDFDNPEGVFLFESGSLHPFACYRISGNMPRIPRLLTE